MHVMTWQTPQHPPCLPTTGSNGQSTFDERKEEQRKDSLLLNQMQNWMLISSQDIYFVEGEPISPHMFGLEMTRLPPIMSYVIIGSVDEKGEARSLQDMLTLFVVWHGSSSKLK